MVALVDGDLGWGGGCGRQADQGSLQFNPTKKGNCAADVWIEIGTDGRLHGKWGGGKGRPLERCYERWTDRGMADERQKCSLHKC